MSGRVLQACGDAMPLVGLMCALFSKDKFSKDIISYVTSGGCAIAC